ncbi:MAG: hypothetical protein ACLSE4_09730 [Clostridium sp.]
MKVLSYIISPEFVYMWIRVATPIIFSSLGGCDLFPRRSCKLRAWKESC